MDRDEHTNTLHGLILGLWTPGLGELRPNWVGRAQSRLQGLQTPKIGVK